MSRRPLGHRPAGRHGHPPCEGTGERLGEKDHTI